MAMPDEMVARSTPPPPPPAVCAITGKPARYRDPATGLPYAGLEAYRELKRRREAGLLGPLVGAAGAAAAAGADAGPAAAAQQAAEASGGGGMALRQSSRLAAQQTAAAQQFVQMQQPLFQPELLLQPQQMFGGIEQQQPGAGLVHLFAQQPVLPAPAAGAVLPGVT